MIKKHTAPLIIFLMTIEQLPAATLTIYNKSNRDIKVTSLLLDKSLKKTGHAVASGVVTGLGTTIEIVTAFGSGYYHMPYHPSTPPSLAAPRIKFHTGDTNTIKRGKSYYWNSGIYDIEGFTWQSDDGKVWAITNLNMPATNIFGKLKIYDDGKFDSSRLGDNQQATLLTKD